MTGNTLLNDALELSSRREFLCKNAKPCQKCGTNQVQLIDHYFIPARWKCRHCNIKFTFEPVC